MRGSKRPAASAVDEIYVNQPGRYLIGFLAWGSLSAGCASLALGVVMLLLRHFVATGNFALVLGHVEAVLFVLFLVLCAVAMLMLPLLLISTPRAVPRKTSARIR